MKNQQINTLLMLIKSEYPWIISTNQQGFVTYKLILSKTCCCEAQLIYSQINRNCRPDRQIFVLELLKTFEINSLFSQVHKFSCVLEGIYEIVTFPQTWQASILHNYHYRSTDPYFFGLDRICKLKADWGPLSLGQIFNNMNLPSWYWFLLHFYFFKKRLLWLRLKVS